MHLAYKEPWQGGCPVPDFAFPLTPAGFQVHPAFLIFRSPWQTTELSRTASSFLSPLNIFPGPFFRPAKEWSNCVFFVFCFLFFVFFFEAGFSKITADGDCSHDIKRCLLLGRKVMTNLDSILKSRDITFPAKVHLGRATVFPVVMYGCESWTIKKAEYWKLDAFELDAFGAGEDSWESLGLQGAPTSPP